MKELLLLMNFEDTAREPNELSEGRVVRLEGGPMAGWVVRPDAPALRPEWHDTWPLSVSRLWKPGRYVRSDAAARWEEAP